jgi:Kef-type K+ transport system membrane component KefB
LWAACHRADRTSLGWLRAAGLDTLVAVTTTGNQGPAHEVASRRRMLVGYLSLLSVVALVIILAFRAGTARDHPLGVGGGYVVEEGSDCLGGRFELAQSGRFINLEAASGATGRLELRGRDLFGTVTCPGQGPQRAELFVEGQVVPRVEAEAEEEQHAFVSGTVGGQEVSSVTRGESEEAISGSEGPPLSAEETFGRLMLAIAAVVLAARFVGALVSRIGQPRVMGEVLAGILLGPTFLGTVAPSFQAELFHPQIVPLLSAGAFVGLAFYMFLVGLELDPTMLRGRFEQAAFISHGSIAIPMALGIAVAVPIFALVGPPTDFVPFALFIGVSMSITAFPVLARILVERRMLKRPVGAMAIGAAAVDDVTAWGLLALAIGVGQAALGSGEGNVGLTLVRIILLTVVFCVVMALFVRRVLARVSDAFDEAGHVPGGWIAAIFVGVLLSAYIASVIPVAAIFGAFVMGMIMPRRAELTHDVTRRFEDFVTTILLPLFFVTTGLKVQVGLLDRPLLWGITLVLLAVAIFCKWVGAMVAARFTGMRWRESAVIGALMNTRGLTELIVLNIGLELHLVTPALFTMLVLMALVTTFMAGPALRLLDPRREFSAPPEEELEEPVAVAPGARPDRAILVAPQDERNLDALIALAEPVARGEPPRELILARLLVPSRAATGGIRTTDRDVAEATRELARRREELEGRDVVARAVAFTSGSPGEDLVRLAGEQNVDLVLLDGRRPLLGGGIPRGDVGLVLEQAPCDVGVLVEREGRPPDVGPDHPVAVPFGGADHDWAALELAAWLASDREAPLRLLGAESERGERDASKLLANASLVVQRLAGVAAEPVLVSPGRQGVLDAAGDAGLLVVGLSERWREEGLGPVRSEIGQYAEAPVLFVRRGQRPGALAPRDDVTRFTWSRVGPA